MEYDQIMQEIIDGLLGDWEKDIAYLNNAAEKYPDSSEITRGIGRLICKIMPDDCKDELDLAYTKEQYYIENVLIEVQKKISDREIEEAEKLLIKVLPDDSMYQSDEVSVYYAFENPIEELYYEEKFKPTKTVRIPPFPYNKVYLLYAYLLFEEVKYDKACKVIDKALRRNPLFSEILFEKAEIYKMQGDMGKFLSTTIQCLELLYQGRDIARYFRNLGYYFIESEKWDEAICSYLVSMTWEESEMAQSQLFYISQQIGTIITPEKYQNWDDILGKYDIPLEPDILWAQVAWAIAEDSCEIDNYDLARFCYSIVYDLTGDEEVTIRMEKCEKACVISKRQS